MPAPNADFEILGIEAWTALDANRNPYDAKRITFRTKFGDVDHVIVRAGGFTSEIGLQAVRQAAAELNKLRGA